MDVLGAQIFMGAWHIDYLWLFEALQIAFAALRCVTIGLLSFGDHWKWFLFVSEGNENGCTRRLRFHDCLVQMTLDRFLNVEECYKWLFGFGKRFSHFLELWREFQMDVPSALSWVPGA